MKAPQLVENFNDNNSINNIIKPSLSQIKEIKPKVINNDAPENNYNLFILIILFLFFLICSTILYERYINKDINKLKYKDNINNLYNKINNYKIKINKS